MTGIFQSLQNLVYSIFAVFGDILNGVTSAFQSLVAVVFTFFQQLANLLKDAVGFLLNNIVILGVIVAAFFAWVALQQRGGASASGQKKRA